MLSELYLSPIAPFKAIHTFWYRYLTLMLGGRQGNVKSYCSQSFWHCDLLKLRYLTTQKQQIPGWAKQPRWHPWTQAEDKSHQEITALTCSHFSCQREMGYCRSHNPQQLMKNTQKLLQALPAAGHAGGFSHSPSLGHHECNIRTERRNHHCHRTQFSFSTGPPRVTQQGPEPPKWHPLPNDSNDNETSPGTGLK